MSKEAKKRRVSREPVLQDLTVSSLSDLNPGIPGPSDTSVFEVIKNYNVSLPNVNLDKTDLNVTSSPYPSDSSLLATIKNVPFKKPFNLKPRKKSKMSLSESVLKASDTDTPESKVSLPFKNRQRNKPSRPSLFDSVLKESDQDTTDENIRRPFQRKKKIRARSSIFELDLDNSESDIAEAKSPCKKLFQQRLKKKEQPNCFDSILDESKKSEPSSPDNEKHRFSKKNSKQRIINSDVFDTDLSNDTINQSHSIPNFITRRKTRTKKSNENSLFGEDLNSSSNDSIPSQHNFVRRKIGTSRTKINSEVFDDILNETLNESQNVNLALPSVSFEKSENRQVNIDQNLFYQLSCSFSNTLNDKKMSVDCEKSIQISSKDNNQHEISDHEKTLTEVDSKSHSKDDDLGINSSHEAINYSNEDLENSSSISKSANQFEDNEEINKDSQNDDSSDNDTTLNGTEEKREKSQSDTDLSDQQLTLLGDMSEANNDKSSHFEEDEENNENSKEDEEQVKAKPLTDSKIREGTSQLEIIQERSRPLSLRSISPVYCCKRSINMLPSASEVSLPIIHQETIKDVPSSTPCVQGKRVSFKLKEDIQMSLEISTVQEKSKPKKTESQVKELNTSNKSVCGDDEEIRINENKSRISDPDLRNSVKLIETGSQLITGRKSSLRYSKICIDSKSINSLAKDTSFNFKKGRRVSFKLDISKDNSCNESQMEQAKLKNNQLSNNNSSFSLDSLVYEEPSENGTPDSESIFIDIHPSRSKSTSVISNTDSLHLSHSTQKSIPENSTDQNDSKYKVESNCSAGNEHSKHKTSGKEDDSACFDKENLGNNDNEEETVNEEVEEEASVSEAEEEEILEKGDVEEEASENEEEEEEASESEEEEEILEKGDAEEEALEREEDEEVFETDEVEEEASESEAEEEESLENDDIEEEDLENGDLYETEMEAEEEAANVGTNSSERNWSIPSQRAQISSLRNNEEQFLEERVTKNHLTEFQKENEPPKIKIPEELFKFPMGGAKQRKKIERHFLKEPPLVPPTKNQLQEMLRRIPFSELKKKKRKSSVHCISREQMQQYEIEEGLKRNKQPEKLFKKPKKLKRPHKWVSQKLYDFIISKLQPQHGLRSRVRAEELVLFLCDHVDRILKKVVFDELREDVVAMKTELANLGVIKTHWDFYEFVMKYFDCDFQTKIFSCNSNLRTAFEFGPEDVSENIL